MAILTKNPFETSFENLTSNAAGAAKKITKTASDAAGNVVKDAKESLTGQPTSGNLVDEVGLKKTSDDQVKQAEENRKQVLAQTRQNLELINQGIKKARDERLKKEMEVKKAKEQEVQKKKMEENKKKEDPMWKKMLKGSMGSKEVGKNISG